MTPTAEKAHSYLKQFEHIEKVIKQNEEQVRMLKDKAKGEGAISYDRDRVQTSPKDTMSETIIDAVDLEREIAERCREMRVLRINTLFILNRIEIGYNRMLSAFYIEHVPMSVIAEEMYMSLSNAYYYKEKALDEFGKCLEDLESKVC